ncbi:transposase [Actinoplanes sp. CA-054009]
MVPKLDESGTSSRHGPPTKAGDPALREALFNAADRARKTDPTLAARYQQLIQAGKHHNSALCTLAAVLVTRLAACWRTRTPYQLKDTNGRLITEAEGRAICVTRYQVTDADRAKNRSPRAAQRQKQTGRRKKESRSAPAAGPSTNHTNHHEAA